VNNRSHNDRPDQKEPIERSKPGCPSPLQNYPNIILGHGGGGELSAELVEHVFLPAFGNQMLDKLGDSAVAVATAQKAQEQGIADRSKTAAELLSQATVAIRRAS